MSRSAAARPARARTLQACLGVLLAAGASGCAYQYDDGLPPLGQRSAAAAASAAASASAAAAEHDRRSRVARGIATAAPLDQPLAGEALQAWASTVLPDTSGVSLARDASTAWPGRPARRMGVAAQPGPATLRVACRGEGLADVRLTAGDVQLLDFTFACNRPWSRPVEVPAGGRLDVQFSAPGDAAANVAYRLTRP
ncbi:hypothetical protein [Sinomonas atrocyanea]|jgi:hypothetical protein|uniref:hypothetical protein n=1 Tax=Sinomonas atrocyanea TaxID=37927 RepID=UPI002781FF8D|nr:hypothetical protein [Sinomonas atrocyanea]MDQ0259029.1 hypothetical protein [Sinomonas atrocyanea]MDR6621864.1 hypothetical protein [Sinomonas atrocyanea]